MNRILRIVLEDHFTLECMDIKEDSAKRAGSSLLLEYFADDTDAKLLKGCNFCFLRVRDAHTYPDSAKVRRTLLQKRTVVCDRACANWADDKSSN